jgi:hypothetical protein
MLALFANGGATISRSIARRTHIHNLCARARIVTGIARQMKQIARMNACTVFRNSLPAFMYQRENKNAWLLNALPERVCATMGPI